jgi:hypothetical protein
MSGQATTEVPLATTVLRGRADAAAGAQVPYLVLDLGRGRDPHQARCRRCRWRSSWRTTTTQAQAEHARHQLAAHAHRRRATRGGPLRLLDRWRRR